MLESWNILLRQVYGGQAGRRRTRVGRASTRPRHADACPDLLAIEIDFEIMAVVAHADVEGFSCHLLCDLYLRLPAGREEDIAFVVHVELHRPIRDTAVLSLEDRRSMRLDDGVGAAPILLGAHYLLPCGTSGRDGKRMRRRTWFVAQMS